MHDQLPNRLLPMLKIIIEDVSCQYHWYFDCFLAGAKHKIIAQRCNSCCVPPNMIYMQLWYTVVSSFCCMYKHKMIWCSILWCCFYTQRTIEIMQLSHQPLSRICFRSSIIVLARFSMYFRVRFMTCPYELSLRSIGSLIYTLFISLLCQTRSSISLIYTFFLFLNCARQCLAFKIFMYALVFPLPSSGCIAQQSSQMSEHIM